MDIDALVVLVLNLSLSTQQIHDWGWRIPFLLTAPLGLIGLYIRNKLEETPEFTALRAEGKVAKRPLLESITGHWRAILRTAGYALFQNAALYVILTFIPSYQESTLGYTATLASISSVVSMVLVCLVIPLTGKLSDTVGRRRVLAGACLLALAFPYPLFVLMDSGSATLAVLAHCGLGIILGVFLGPTLAAMNELFSTRVRYGGFSLGYNFSVSAFGGTAPFLVTLLVAETGITASPAFYVMASAAITLGVVLATRETAPHLTGRA